MEEIYARKLVVLDPDDEGGPVVTIENGTIRFDGPSHHGWLIIGFDARDKDKAAGLALVSTDGKSTVKIRGAAEGTGISIHRGDKYAALDTAGLVLSDQQRAVISDAGIAVNDENGEAVFEVPFMQSAFVREITESVVSQVKAWLADKLKISAAS